MYATSRLNSTVHVYSLKQIIKHYRIVQFVMYVTSIISASSFYIVLESSTYNKLSNVVKIAETVHKLYRDVIEKERKLRCC